jgi:thymidylate synthase (FAD)
VVAILEVELLDRGSVELMSNTQDGDLLVVNAARCSFDKQHEIYDEKKDAKLINYLAEHGHVLPFRHPVATLRISCPIFVLRQLGKHQVGFSWSEVSRRYITSPPLYHLPTFWRTKAENVKQGSSSEPHKESHKLTEDAYRLAESSLVYYEHLLEQGVCPEQARMVLPQSMYTTCVTTGTLLGWHHLYKLRTEEHTQLETQEYAQAIGEIMGKLFPVSWEALCKHS